MPDSAQIDGSPQYIRVQSVQQSVKGPNSITSSENNILLAFTIPHFYVSAAIDPGLCHFYRIFSQPPSRFLFGY
jgi:hypothetical protein